MLYEVPPYLPLGFWPPTGSSDGLQMENISEQPLQNAPFQREKDHSAAHAPFSDSLEASPTAATPVFRGSTSQNLDTHSPCREAEHQTIATGIQT